MATKKTVVVKKGKPEDKKPNPFATGKKGLPEGFVPFTKGGKKGGKKDDKKKK